MYRINSNGVEIIWTPLDKALGISIVREVTGKTSTDHHLVEVTEEQRDKIQALYAERNSDPVLEEPIPDPGALGLMGTEIAKLKVENMKKDQHAKLLGGQIAGLKLELMKLKGGDK